MKIRIVSATFLAIALLITSCKKPCSTSPTGTDSGKITAQTSLPAGKVTFEQFVKAGYKEKNQIIRALKEAKASDSDTIALYVQILDAKGFDAFSPGETIIKKRVADNLGAIGRAGAPALSALAKMVITPDRWDYNYRRRAAEAIGNIGPPVDDTIIRALVAAANNGFDAYDCADVLEKLGDKGREGMLGLVSSENDDVSEAAAYHLLESGQCTKEDLLKRVQEMNEPKRSQRIKEWKDAWSKMDSEK